MEYGLAGQRMFYRMLGVALAAIGLIGPATRAAEPVGEPVLDPPTLHCIAAYWIVRDDDAHRASVATEYRPAGTDEWQPGPPFLRVQPGPFKDEGGKVKPPAVAIPDGARLFAGSVFVLAPDTAYELKLTLRSAAGPTTQRVLRTHTMAEPVAPPDMAARHVVPGAGGGSGTPADPFRGLKAADAAARPGDLFLVHAGLYAGTFTVTRGGQPGRPVIWRGAGDGVAIIDGQQPRENPTANVIDLRNQHDVWLENLAVCHGYAAICGHECERLVIRRCHLYDVLEGVLANRNRGHVARDFFIADNVLEGMMPWPATPQQWHDLPESRGIWIAGPGHVCCYNRIHHFKDGMDVDESAQTISCDFHNNDVSCVFDDGCEMDGSDRNTRNFYNRYTNVLCGVSLQPVHGGPVYVFRNVIYNIRNEPFKLHNSPSGGIIVHNTTVRHGPPASLSTQDPVFNCMFRNNLLVGTAGRAYDFSPPAMDCDFDYDGYAGWSGDTFLKWNGIKYKSLAEVQAKAPIERHAVELDPATLFAGGTAAPATETTVYDGSKIDLQLKPGCRAIGAGVALPGFNDGAHGVAPDLGAYQAGAPLPHYGPRMEVP